MSKCHWPKKETWGLFRLLALGEGEIYEAIFDLALWNMIVDCLYDDGRRRQPRLWPLVQAKKTEDAKPLLLNLTQ